MERKTKRERLWGERERRHKERDARNNDDGLNLFNEKREITRMRQIVGEEEREPM